MDHTVNIKKALIAFLMFLTSIAQAGIYLEPYAGFSLAGNLEQKTTTFPTTGDYSGVQFGGRVGYSLLGIMGGLTANMALSTELDNSSGVFSSKDSANRRDIGVFAGYNFPILIRAWASYYFSSRFEGEDPSIYSFSLDNTETLKGSGYAVGVGFTGLPMLSLNLELRNFTYDEIEDIDTNPQTTTLTTEYTASEIFLSVSLPFNL